MSMTHKMTNGAEHPLVGFGTFTVGYNPETPEIPKDPAAAKQIILDAVKAGYRYFDCADFYGNEEMIGAGFRECGVPRSELFIVSKVWMSTIVAGKDAIKKQCDVTIQRLGVEYLDVYLLHWPVPKHSHAAYQALEELLEEGKIRGIGLSNFCIEDYEELKTAGIKVKPVVNQFELSPALLRPKTVAYFQKEEIFIESYRTLGSGTFLKHEGLGQMAAKMGKTVAQVLGRWCVQKGFAFIPKSANPTRMAENRDLDGWSLSDAQMTEVETLLKDDGQTQKYADFYKFMVVRDTGMGPDDVPTDRTFD